jgi:hypothetical protein
MNDDPPRFPLRIQSCADGIEWTHIYGKIGHVRTPAEIPDALWKRLLPIVDWLSSRAKNFVLGTDALPNAPEGARETLALTAWWMEWDHRRVLARGERAWGCPDCAGQVSPKRGLCDNPRCESWNTLFQITGEPNLRLVPQAQTA